MSKNTNIIFIRHGETDLNFKKVYFGHLDPSLNKLGIEQINNTKKFFPMKKLIFFIPVI